MTTDQNDLAEFFDFAASLTAIPELSFEGGSITFDRCKDNYLARRTTGTEYKLVIFILGRTTNREWAKIPIDDYRRRTGVSSRMIYFALASLEKKGFIVRQRRRGVKACPQTFDVRRDDPAFFWPLPARRTCRSEKNLQNCSSQVAPSPEKTA